MHSIRNSLWSALRPRVSVAALDWLERAQTIARGLELEPVLNVYTAAAKQVGGEALAPGEAELSDMAGAAPGLSFDQWTTGDAARAIVILAGAEEAGAGDAWVAIATQCYERGDAREQQSWLRAVSLLPDSERFVALAVDACRSNILPVFESIACENPFPVGYFPDRNFNQVVLKALFNNVALARIVGLRRRLNPELARMAHDYAAERRAAGRSVPVDISLAWERADVTEEFVK